MINVIDLKHRSELTTINVVNALLGAFLIISPWLVGYTADWTGTWSAVVAGLLIGGVALTGIVEMREWEAWVNLGLGLLAAVAPWLLGFSGAAYAMWTHVATGLAVAILAAVEIWMLHDSSSTRAA